MVAETIRWETMDKVERKATGCREGGRLRWKRRGTGDVTALISSRCRRGPGGKQKAIRHQTFKLENSPAGPWAGLPPFSSPPKASSNPLFCVFPQPRRAALNLHILLSTKPHTIPAVATVA